MAKAPQTALSGAPQFGVNDLPEFHARMAELRKELGVPREPGAFEASTDGACLGNPNGPGGWAAVVEHLGSATPRPWELWGHLSSTSNNRAEALGLLAAVEWIPEGSALLLRSDSELTVNILKGTYKARKNVDVWTEIRARIRDRGVTVTPQWVRGHAGDAGNERADALSVLGAVNGDVERWERQRSSGSRASSAPSPRREPATTPPELEGIQPRGPWESEFIASVAKQLRAGRQLSEKQQAVVERIRSRVRAESAGAS